LATAIHHAGIPLVESNLEFADGEERGDRYLALRPHYQDGLSHFHAGTTTISGQTSQSLRVSPDW
jgi:hypothetical protein